MARKIIDKLFPPPENFSPKEDSDVMYVSLKDWKTLVSRLDRTQAQVEACNEKLDLIYSKVMKWLSRIREKLSSLSEKQKELDSTTKQAFQKWEEKILNWVQPEQRKEDQRRVMDLMHRNSQFIQSYGKEMDSLKKALSKNEHQLYQLLEQMRTVRIEMDLINRHQQREQTRSTSSHLEESAYSSDLTV
ncbi:MAG: hypothetical protein OXM55_03145 [Bdellovibrionales bacterium]|nr:hypothetical protein [Bdellovibrionales bacterium]